MSSAPPPPPYTDQKPMYPQQAPPPAPPLVLMGQPVYVRAPIIIIGDYPIQCTCSHCGQQIVTRTQKSVGLLAWLICGILFIFGLWVCCCIPFCVDACKDTEHYCPSCSALLGVHKKL